MSSTRAGITAIQPGDFRSSQSRGPVALIDVRTPAEFREVHVEGARNVPLSNLNPDALLREHAARPDVPLVFICRSGARSQKACEAMVAAGAAQVAAVSGGTLACIEAGLPIVRGPRAMSLERQVRIAAGSLVLIGCFCGWLVHPSLFGIAAFIGAGLVFAGVTDTCGMGMLLAHMPWKTRDEQPNDQASPG